MSKHILVIDDDEAVRKSFILALSSTGYINVDTAESGEKGIMKARKNKYDLIFLDLKMPGIDGIETMRELRKMDKDVPIYIITAFHREFFDRLRGALEDGMDFELLRKPIGRDQILSITKGILDEPTEY